MNRWKVALLRPVVMLYQVALNLAGRIPGARYARFLSLDARAKGAIERGQPEQARELAQELLNLADRYPRDWNYGNALHQAHIVLGRAALGSGDVATARAELLLAGATPGSPQLDSFGPSMRLAQDLLRAGESRAVLEYFQLCRRFWKLGAQTLVAWADEVELEHEPNFGPNLRY